MIRRLLVALLIIPLGDVAFCDDREADDSTPHIDIDITSFEAGGKVDGLEWTSNSASLAVLIKIGRNSRSVQLFDAQNGKRLNQVFATAHVMTAIALAPKNDSICYAIWRAEKDPFASEAQIWGLRTRDQVATFAGPPTTDRPRMTSDVLTVRYSPDGKLIAGGSKLVSDGDISGQHLGGEVWVWDVQSGKMLWRDRNTHTDIVYATVFSPDGRLLASGGQDKLIRIWEPTSGRLLKTLHGAAWNGVVSLTFVGHGEFLASGGQGFEEGYQVRVWDVESGNLVRTFRGFRRDATNRVAANPNSSRLFAVGLTENSDNDRPTWHVQCWDTKSGKRIFATPPESGFPRTIAVSKDEIVAVGTFEGRVVVFRTNW